MARSASPNRPAAPLYHCTNADCGAIWSRDQLLGERFGDQEVLLCPKCRLGAAPLLPDRSFGDRVPAAFAYPFLGNGRWMLLGGTLLLAVLEAGRGVGFVLWFIGSVFLYGYFGLLLLDVVRTTAADERHTLEWPDVGGFGEVVAGALQILRSFGLVFAPALVCWLYGWNELSVNPDSWKGWWLSLLALLFGLVGLLYYPMAFLVLALFDTVAATQPFRVLPAIARAHTHYALVLVLLIALYLLRVTATTSTSLFGWWLRVPLLLPVEFVELYTLLVSARLLGLLYRSNEEKFGWLR